ICPAVRFRRRPADRTPRWARFSRIRAPPVSVRLRQPCSPSRGSAAPAPPVPPLAAPAQTSHVHSPPATPAKTCARGRIRSPPSQEFPRRAGPEAPSGIPTLRLGLLLPPAPARAQLRSPAPAQVLAPVDSEVEASAPFELREPRRQQARPQSAASPRAWALSVSRAPFHPGAGLAASGSVRACCTLPGTAGDAHRSRTLRRRSTASGGPTPYRNTDTACVSDRPFLLHAKEHSYGFPCGKALM